MSQHRLRTEFVLNMYGDDQRFRVYEGDKLVGVLDRKDIEMASNHPGKPRWRRKRRWFPSANDDGVKRSITRAEWPSEELILDADEGVGCGTRKDALSLIEQWLDG